MSMWFSYMLLGISLSAPVGPVNVAQIKAGLRGGFWNAWCVGIGAMCADVVFMLLIYFGAAAYVTTPLAKLIIWLLGCGVLLKLGYDSIRDARSVIDTGETGGSPRQESAGSSFLSGFLIAIANPMNIVFWIGIYGSVMTKTLESSGSGQALWLSCAIFAGVCLWDFSVSLVVHLSRRAVSPRLMKWISILAGWSLIGFGVYFGYAAVQQTVLLLRG